MTFSPSFVPFSPGFTSLIAIIIELRGLKENFPLADLRCILMNSVERRNRKKNVGFPRGLSEGVLQ